MKDQLIAEYGKLIEGEKALPTIPESFKSGYVGQLATTFEAIASMLSTYGGAFEAVGKASESARKGAPDASGARTADRYRLIPVVNPDTLGLIVYQGSRPHSCEHCHHDLTGGIAVDLERSAAATEAAKTELAKLPIACAVLVTPGLAPEAKLTAQPVKARSGGRSGEGAHSGPKGENALADLAAHGVTTLPPAVYRGATYHAEVIDTDTGYRVKITDAGALNVLKGSLHASVSGAANAIVQAVYAAEGLEYDPTTNRVDGKKFFSLKGIFADIEAKKAASA